MLVLNDDVGDLLIKNRLRKGDSCLCEFFSFDFSASPYGFAFKIGC